MTEKLFGFIFIILFFLPMTTYRYLGPVDVGPNNIEGHLYGFQTPIGYIALVLGILLLFYKSLPTLKKISAESLLTGGSLVIIASHLFLSGNFLLAYHHINGSFHIDRFLSWYLIISVISLITGFSIQIKRAR